MIYILLFLFILLIFNHSRSIDMAQNQEIVIYRMFEKIVNICASLIIDYLIGSEFASNTKDTTNLLRCCKSIHKSTIHIHCNRSLYITEYPKLTFCREYRIGLAYNGKNPNNKYIKTLVLQSCDHFDFIFPPRLHHLIIHSDHTIDSMRLPSTLHTLELRW